MLQRINATLEAVYIKRATNCLRLGKIKSLHRSMRHFYGLLHPRPASSRPDSLLLQDKVLRRSLKSEKLVHSSFILPIPLPTTKSVVPTLLFHREFITVHLPKNDSGKNCIGTRFPHCLLEKGGRLGWADLRDGDKLC